jgi:DNA-binding HxlR family transcriptional regulator
MNTYGQYCPLARAMEVIGDRWTLLIVRDLAMGASRYNDLERGLPGISRPLLAQRLRWLQRAGLVDRHGDGKGRPVLYGLTAAGRALQPVLDALVAWGAQWAFGEPRPEELDPLLLLWWMRNGIHDDRLPQCRIVVEFLFCRSGVQTDRYWLLLEQGDRSICLKPPGFDTDVLVRAELAAMYEVWVGRITFAEALQDARIELDATPALIRAFPTWFALSAIAPAVKAARIDRHAV